MLKKTSRWLARLMVASSLLLVGVCTFLIYKDQETLSLLGHPGENLRVTSIYSRWLEITLQSPPSWERTMAWLAALGYRSVSGTPHEPGEVASNYPEIVIFCRPF